MNAFVLFSFCLRYIAGGEMNPFWCLTLLLCFVCTATRAVEVSGKVVDGLGRPVANAVVDIHWLKSLSENDVRAITLLKLHSDHRGLISGRYNEKLIPSGEDVWVTVSKKGYAGFSMTSLKNECVLEQKFDKADVRRIANLKDEMQIQAFREFLAGDFEPSGTSPDDLIFIEETKFRAALRSLVSDPRVSKNAIRLLALIGLPEDLRHIIDHAPAPKRELFEDRWAYSVACALLEPSSDREWAFLRRCASDEYDDRWVDAGAIQTLKLLASPRSRQILVEAEKTNNYCVHAIANAIKYIDSTPSPLSDKNLLVAGEKVAKAIRIGKWTLNSKPRFNRSGDKALVNCEFRIARDLLIYTATFHKIDDVWKLRGVRETMQALMAESNE